MSAAPGIPNAKEPIKRLEPLELPLLELAKWKAEHPWYKFLHSPDGAEMGIKVGETIGLEVLGHAVKVLSPLGWIHLGVEIALASARDDDAREAQLKAWHAQMWEKFWANEAAYPSESLREAAFDKSVGDNANHAIVPRLTEAAELRRQELIYQANERWFANIEAMAQAQKDLEILGPRADAEHADLVARAAEARKNAELYVLMDPARAASERRWAEWAENAVKQGNTTEEGFLAHRARETMEGYKADVQAVIEFEANPSNWDLTPEQRALLNDTVCDAPLPPASVSDGGLVSHPGSDGADKIYDVVGGRPK